MLCPYCTVQFIVILLQIAVSHFIHNCSNVKKKVEINKNKRGPSVPYPYRIHLCVKNIKFK